MKKFTILLLLLFNAQLSIFNLQRSMVNIMANDGVYYTKTIFATKGRASYLGARSIGHEDPGASSYKFILEAIYNEIKEQ